MATIQMTRDAFRACMIAQDDDEDYSESGYFAGVLPDGRAVIASYSHCSCYGTFDALCGGGIGDWLQEGEVRFDWSGTVEALIDMARRTADPALPDRTADPGDYDYDHLQAVYRDVLAWADKRETTR